MNKQNKQARHLAAIQARRGVRVGSRWLNAEPQSELRKLALTPPRVRDPRRTEGQL
jgi:hypothetical protein